MAEGRVYEDLHSMCCDAALKDVEQYYVYKIKNPDTRWYACTECDARWGYHRMKKTWSISPQDYSHNEKVKKTLGLP